MLYSVCVDFQYLDPSCCLHAVGQGALAVECREGDAESLRAASSLSHRETLLACVAERAFMRVLEGGCSAPVAAHAEVSLQYDALRVDDYFTWSIARHRHWVESKLSRGQ